MQWLAQHVSNELRLCRIAALLDGCAKHQGKSIQGFNTVATLQSISCFVYMEDSEKQPIWDSILFAQIHT